MSAPSPAAFPASIKFGEELTNPNQILNILKGNFEENDEDDSGGLVTPQQFFFRCRSGCCRVVPAA